ncbi:hypothetical protein KAW50_00045 [candidate division WOR-3 bacterium]|nr:hypothetical protein [candidate division WOR-3 bacterium]
MTKFRIQKSDPVQLGATNLQRGTDRQHRIQSPGNRNFLYPAFCFLFSVFCLVSSCSSNKEQILFITGTYPAKPGWAKKSVTEGENFMYFTGVSNYKRTKKEARNEAIDEAVKTFLIYAGVKEGENLEAFRKEFTSQIITLRGKEPALYNITIDDFYWEKYALKKRKIRLYKGHILLKWPTPRWTEFRRYVRQSSRQRFPTR